MNSVRTMVIVANDRHARFLENTGPGQGLRELKVMEETEAVGFADFPGRSQAATFPGPSQAAASEARHGFQRPSGEEEHARDIFANEIVKTAGKLWSEHPFDRLVMAAPPKMLGVLRAKLAAPLDDALFGDLDKDLTHVTVHDLPGHFADLADF